MQSEESLKRQADLEQDMKKKLVLEELKVNKMRSGAGGEVAAATAGATDPTAAGKNKRPAKAPGGGIFSRR